jgi:hypothetical protein
MQLVDKTVNQLHQPLVYITIFIIILSLYWQAVSAGVEGNYPKLLHHRPIVYIPAYPGQCLLAANKPEHEPWG